MGERGGMEGDAPPLASKNLYPHIKPKIRVLQKNLGEKKEKIDSFENIFFIFCSFLSEEMALMLLKTLLFFLMFSQKSVFFCKKFVCPPLYPSPRRAKSIPSPRAILGGTKNFEASRKKSAPMCEYSASTTICAPIDHRCMYTLQYAAKCVYYEYERCT